METDAQGTIEEPETDEAPEETGTGPIRASYLVRIHLRDEPLLIDDIEKLIESSLGVNASVSAERLDK